VTSYSYVPRDLLKFPWMQYIGLIQEIRHMIKRARKFGHLSLCLNSRDTAQHLTTQQEKPNWFQI
jgi:hypothetical protein